VTARKAGGTGGHLRALGVGGRRLTMISGCIVPWIRRHSFRLSGVSWGVLCEMAGLSCASRRRLVQDYKAGSDEYDDGDDGDGNNSRIGD